MPDELETILRLVADGRLSAEEAAPIIEALTRASDLAEGADNHAGRAQRHADRLGRRIDRAFAHAESRFDRALGGQGMHLRIRVTEKGRQVVNLNIPIGLVEKALHFVPGLGAEQRERVRDAVRAGAIGPIVDVEDEDGGGVLITVE